MFDYKLNKNKCYEQITSYLIFMLLVILWSPFFPGYLGIPSVTFYSLVTIFLFFLIKKFSIKAISVLIISYIILFIFFIATESQAVTNRYISVPITIYVCWYFSSNVNVVKKIVDLLSIFAVIAVIMSIISFVYVFSGGSPFLDFPNPDGRTNMLYLTSFSNAKFLNIVRPAFIYDEPGALSFVLFTIAAMREILRKNKKVTFFIIIGGSITLSLTHFILVLLTFLFFSKFKHKMMFIIMLTPLIMYTSQMKEFNFLYDRFEINGNTIAGDNRSNQISNFFKVVDKENEILLLGNYKCFNHPYKNRCPEHGDISSNPFTPIYMGGISLFLLQIIIHSLLILCFLRKKERYAVLILSLLLLQRPYFHNFGYTYLVYFLCFMILNSEKYKTKFKAIYQKL